AAELDQASSQQSAGRERVEQRYTWEATAQRWLEVLAEAEEHP
ncbi:hypothetical protein BN871_BN_00040, partial [Paenibacillus sp. P22]